MSDTRIFVLLWFTLIGSLIGTSPDIDSFYLVLTINLFVLFGTDKLSFTLGWPDIPDGVPGQPRLSPHLQEAA